LLSPKDNSRSERGAIHDQLGFTKEQPICKYTSSRE